MAFFSIIRLHYKGNRKQFYNYISTVQRRLCKVSDVITHWEFWKTCYNSSSEFTSFSLCNLGATALSQSPSLTKGLKEVSSFSPLKLLTQSSTAPPIVTDTIYTIGKQNLENWETIIYSNACNKEVSSYVVDKRRTIITPLHFCWRDLNMLI